MRLWIKYLIGAVLGIVASFVIPMENPAVHAFFDGCSEFAIRFGRYTLLPLLFFGVTYSIYRLRETKILFKTGVLTMISIVAFTLILLVIGLISILVVKLPRIPIPSEKITEIPTVDIRNLVMMIFPFSGFDAVKDGQYLLPAFVFAAFVGYGATVSQGAAKSVISLVESAATVFYNVTTFFVEWASVGMVAVSCYWASEARTTFASSTFLPLCIMLLVDFVLVSVVVYPLILRLVCKDPRPFHILYASICPVIAAFFSGDSNFVLQLNIRHGKESLGIHDETNNFAQSLFAIFSRGGTALVSSICFIVIVRSYSALGSTLSDVSWIFCSAFAISFVLGGIPKGGSFVALALLCTLYGRGFDTRYLLLKPAAPIFCSFAAAFDVLSALYGSYIVAVKTKHFDHVEFKHFI